MLINGIPGLNTSFTYRQIMAFNFVVNTGVYWLIFFSISLISKYCSRRYSPRGWKGSQTSNSNLDFSDNSNTNFLNDRDQQPDNSDLSLYDSFHGSENDQKNIIFRYIESITSWLGWIMLAFIPTWFAAFSMIPAWLGIMLSLAILFVRFCKSLIINCPLSVRRKHGDKKLYRKIWATMLRIYPKKVICGFIGICIISSTMNLLTYKSCVNDHVTADFGINFMPGGTYIYSSAFTRLLTIEKVCPPGPPCHVYTTLPFDTSSSVFINVHTHVDVKNITINYETQANYNLTQSFSLQAFSSYTTSPTKYDSLGERNIHVVLLTGLIPDEIYNLEVYYDDESKYTSTYRTLPSADSDSSYTLIYGGDMGVSSATTALTSLLVQQDPRAMIIGGDFAYDNGEPSCYYTMDLVLQMFEKNLFSPLNRLVPMIVSVGNHDVGFDSLASVNVPVTESGPSYYTMFPQQLPESGNGNTQRAPQVTERSTYHAHMIGNILNVVLDPGYMTTYNATQLEWLQNISQSYSQYPKVAIYHDPTMSACSTNTSANFLNGLDHWVPIFDDQNYMAVFEHHTHTFKRTFPLRGMVPTENGTIYLGEGDWGVNPYTCKYDNSTGIFANYGSVNHLWVINVDQGNSAINYQAIGLNNTLVDTPISQDLLAYSSLYVNGNNDL